MTMFPKFTHKDISKQQKQSNCILCINTCGLCFDFRAIINTGLILASHAKRIYDRNFTAAAVLNSNMAAHFYRGTRVG